MTRDERASKDEDAADERRRRETAVMNGDACAYEDADATDER